MFTLEDKINIALTYIATDDKTLRKKLKSMAAEAVKDAAFPSESTPVQSTHEPRPSDVDDLIMDHLKMCGVPPHILGHGYLITAIKLCLADPEQLRKITYILYPNVAFQHNTTPSRTERAIRHAIEVCFDRADMDYIVSVFGNTMDVNRGKLTNSEFIAGSVNQIKSLMK